MKRSAKAALDKAKSTNPRLLLDSQALLWMAGEEERLSTNAKEILLRSGVELYLSAASIWEIAIKLSIKKIELQEPLEELLDKQVSINRIQILSVSMAHAIAVQNLPFHHRDPFDRLLVAQAKIEELAILSSDSALDSYGVSRIW